MALPDLTPREALALDLEHTTENLWVLVDRHAREADAPDAPTRPELEGLVEVLRRLDAIGAELGPNLYRAAAQRRGPLDLR